MDKEHSIAPIREGTVIDHIPSGKALQLIHRLKFQKVQHQMAIGVCLKSKKYGLKDLIKIEGILLPDHLTQGIAIFAPDATINYIKNFEVIEKKCVSIPDRIIGVLRCPNGKCISQKEPVNSLFHVEARGQGIELCCHFCGNAFKDFL